MFLHRQLKIEEKCKADQNTIHKMRTAEGIASKGAQIKRERSKVGTDKAILKNGGSSNKQIIDRGQSNS